MTQPEYSREEVDRLLALRDAATPGPWSMQDAPMTMDWLLTSRNSLQSESGAYHPLAWFHWQGRANDGLEQSMYNCQLAASAHALADQLTAARDLLDAKDKEIERLLDVLLRAGGNVIHAMDAAQEGLNAGKYVPLQSSIRVFADYRQQALQRNKVTGFHEQALRTDSEGGTSDPAAAGCPIE